VKNIEFIDLQESHRPYSEDLHQAVISVIDSGVYIGGKILEQFESEFGRSINCTARGVGNGTDALQIALMALEIGPGDEVIVPSFSYAASAEVIMLLGATPVWCDIHPGTFNIDAESASKVTSEKTKAIIAVHLYGQCADIEALESYCPGIPIIEDTAQSYGAYWIAGKYSGSYAGTVGTFGTFSFFPTKPLGGLGDGGAIVSNDSALFNRAVKIAAHGQSEKYKHQYVGVNSRLDPIQASVLKIKLKHVEAATKRKQLLGREYDKGIVNPLIQVPELDSASVHVYHQYTLRIKEGKRDLLAKHLKSKGIPTMVYYPLPLHEQEAYRGFTTRVDVSQSILASQEALSIPIHENLTDDQQNYIIHCINEFKG
jgi:dTDP-4-amino-4,6-dideoxygalactose transaminase